MKKKNPYLLLCFNGNNWSEKLSKQEEFAPHGSEFIFFQGRLFSRRELCKQEIIKVSLVKVLSYDLAFYDQFEPSYCRENRGNLRLNLDSST